MVGKIAPRYGVEVYVSEGLDVCLKQSREYVEDPLIILNPAEAKEMIPLLQQAIAEAESLLSELDEDD